MKEIKNFVEIFFDIEAKKNTLAIKPDIDAYNSAAKEYNSYVTGLLKTLYLSELKDEEVYEIYEDQEDFRPRHLFKISQYKHKKCGDVWVAYISPKDPSPDIYYLKEAIFIIQEDDSFKVAMTYVYSDHDSDGHSYQWEGLAGDPNLTFASLEGPFAIERYHEPEENFDGLKHYLDNI